MKSWRLSPSSQPKDMRRNSVPASYAIVESWPDLGDPHKILVQPPESPIIARKSTKCDPISFNPASYRLSNGAKPFVPRAQPKLSSSPASLYPLLEELEVGEGLSCLDHRRASSSIRQRRANCKFRASCDVLYDDWNCIFTSDDTGYYQGGYTKYRKVSSGVLAP